MLFADVLVGVAVVHLESLSSHLVVELRNVVTLLVDGDRHLRKNIGDARPCLGRAFLEVLNVLRHREVLQILELHLGLFKRQIDFISSDADDAMRWRICFDVLQPVGGLLSEGFSAGNIVHDNCCTCIPIVNPVDRLKSFMPSRVPKLDFYSSLRAWNFNDLFKKVGRNSGLLLFEATIEVPLKYG